MIQIVKRFKISTSFIAVIFLAILSLITGCNTSSSTNEKVIEVEIDSSHAMVRYKNSLFCTPSPIQLSLFLKKIKYIEDESLVNNPVNVASYTSSIKKALNIGIYGADISYLRLFPNTKDINQYILAIKQLASDLNISDAYNTDLMQKIEENINNNDSLFKYFSLLYRDADQFLKENARIESSTLIIVGGWVESFYILTQVYNKNRQNELYSFISQQKYALENIIKLMAPYYNTSQEITNYTDQLVDLAYQFDVIELKYQTLNPPLNYKEGVYEINSTTDIENSMKEIEGIILKTKVLRNSIVL